MEYKVHTRTAHGLHRKYREYVVRPVGGTLTYGPFLTRKQAQRQADELNRFSQVLSKNESTTT